MADLVLRDVSYRWNYEGEDSPLDGARGRGHPAFTDDAFLLLGRLGRPRAVFHYRTMKSVRYQPAKGFRRGWLALDFLNGGTLWLRETSRGTLGGVVLYRLTHAIPKQGSEG